MRIDLFLLGFVEFSLCAEDGEAVFECLRQAGISPKAPERDKKSGEIRFFTTAYGAKRVQRLCPQLRELGRGGIPVLFSALLRREGLFVGTVLGVFLLVASCLFVWDVRVEGNERISTAEVLSELAEAGLSTGRFLPTLDRDGIALSVRQRDGRLAFVSINLRGTVAYVQLREALPQPPTGTIAPANLVAARDGVVTLPLIFEGQALVHEGDVVRAGQILAGGVLDSEKHGYRVTRAAGQVFARTVHTYTVAVPFTYEKQVPTGKEKYEISVSFFGFEGKVFKSTGNSYMSCDIIQNIKRMRLSDGTPLPVTLTVTRFMPYGTCTVVRSATEARALAHAELAARLAADSAGRTTLSRTVETLVDADGITLICTLVCEEDIALTAEFAYVPNHSERTFYEPRDHQNREQ